MPTKLKVRLAYDAVRLAPGWAAALLLASACTSGGSTDGSDSAVVVGDASAEAGKDASLDADDLDADEDAGPEEDTGPDAGDAEQDAGDGAPNEDATGRPCQVDSDCDDKLLCNGAEKCVKDAASGASTCAPGEPIACTFEHPCTEQTKGCDCRNLDVDMDGAKAKICGYDDCDDSRPECNPTETEVCDLQNLDEDCKPDTFHTKNKDGSNADPFADRDRDGYLDVACKNFNPDTKKWHGGNDCDDRDRSVHPEATEACNYIDDNCNKLVDEADKGGVLKEDELKIAFYPDFDQDNFADMRATPRIECDYRKPIGYTFASAEPDCNDTPRTGFNVHPNAPELCDGVDNDCDDKIDEKEDVRIPYDFEDTTLECKDAAVVITSCPPNKRWCGADASRGCSTDETRLDTCRACSSGCQFACGQKGCDEVVEVVAGADHACALTTDGRVACWGRGALGQLGNVSAVQSSTPTLVVGLPPSVKGLAAGAAHTCAIVGSERELYCWGSNRSNQLGNDVAGGFSAAPVLARGIGDARRIVGVKQVAAGDAFTCALLDTGRVLCFGESSNGRVGNGIVGGTGSVKPAALVRTSFDLGFPLDEIVEDASAIAVGNMHACIITRSGKVDCWGSNEFGQLGQPLSTKLSESALNVAQLEGATALTLGTSHSCVISQGKLFCWGDDSLLELGRGPSPDRTNNWQPKPISALGGVSVAAAGSGFTCAAHDAGTSCWGSNAERQLGPGFSGDATHTPIQLSADKVSAIGAGRNYACAVHPDKTLRCWGRNFDGQLANGTLSTFEAKPTKVLPLK